MQRLWKRLRLGAAGAAACLPLCLHAGEVPASAETCVVYNGGFELGAAGFALIRYLRLSTNPQMQYAPPQADEANKQAGRSSLRISNQFAEAYELISREFRLQPDTEYRCSFYLKTSRAGYPLSASIASVGYKDWKVFSQPCEGATSWTRHEWKFTTPAGSAFEFYYFRLRFGEAVEPAEVWLDELQVSPAATPAPNSSGPAVEAAVIMDAPVLVRGTEPVVIRAKALVVNHTPQVMTTALTLRLLPERYPENQGEKAIPLTLQPGEVRQIPVEFTAPVLDTYAIRPDLDRWQEPADAGRLAAARGTDFCTVLGAYQPQPLQLLKDFCIGLNGTLMPYRPNWSKAEEGFRAFGAGPEDYLQIMRKSGLRLLRDWSITWNRTQPEAEKFQFAYPDWVESVTRKHDVELLSEIGQMDFMDRKEGWGETLPAWLQQRSKVRAEFPLKTKYAKGCIYLPPMADWERWLTAIGDRYKGKIRFYEVFNEPNLMFRLTDAGEYLQYVAAASRIFRTASAENRVVGFCVTGDLGGKPTEFLEECARQGGLQLADIVSFHPYNARTLASALPADTQIRQLNEIVRKAGGADKPLWNTELYYPGDQQNGFGQEANFTPAQLAHRFLVDLAEGVGQAPFALADSLWASRLTPHQKIAQTTQYSPNNKLLALNALARFLEGARPAGAVRWTPASICYLYRKDSRLIAAFWHYGHDSKLAVTLPALPAEAELFDLLGNALPRPKAGESLPLGPEPYYLMLPAKHTAEDIRTLLGQAEVKAKIPVTVKQIQLQRTDPDGVALLTLHNHCTEAQSLRVGLRGEGIFALQPVECLLRAGEELTLKVPVRISSPTPQKMVVKCALEGQLYDLTPPSSNTP